MAKATDVRPKITLACTECKERNYITKKNRRNDPDRLDLAKFCPRCKKHTTHRETRCSAASAPREAAAPTRCRRPLAVRTRLLEWSPWP